MNIKTIKHAYVDYSDTYACASEAERLAHANGNLELAEIYAFIGELLLDIERLYTK